MKTVFTIGNGGIGSYFAQHIDNLIELEQIKGYNFQFYDDDKVELKNILYQNFDTGDIDSYKSEALSFKYYNVSFHTKRLSYDDLLNSDLVILCADNNKIRKEAYKLWENKKVPFIDSRANGKAIGIFSNETENYLSTISDDEQSSSCQNPFQLEKKEIEYGNVVIAAALAQVVLNYSRTSKLPSDFRMNF